MLVGMGNGALQSMAYEQKKSWLGVRTQAAACRESQSARTTDHELMWVSLASESAWRTYTKALCVPSTPGDANSGSTNLVESGTYTKYMCEDE